MTSGTNTTSTPETQSRPSSNSPTPETVMQKPKEATTSSLISPEIVSFFIGSWNFCVDPARLIEGIRQLADALGLPHARQVQPRTSDGQYKGVWRSLLRMWKEEGFKGFMRGNGINCLRIVPYSAVQFTTYEQLKKIADVIVVLLQFFTRHGSKELDTPKRLASGALAGITSVCSTYPLDLVRSRLSIATASIALASPSTVSSASSATSTAASAATLINTSSPSSIPKHAAATAAAFHTTSPTPSLSTVAMAGYTKADLSIMGMTLKIMREEGGIRGLYRGLVTTSAGVAPYVGINFAAYEFLRGVITPPGKSGIGRKLTCGALAGTISQTLTYPFDVLRRKMQVAGMKGGSVKYNGALHALTSIIKTEGVAGLYRGLWPNLRKQQHLIIVERVLMNDPLTVKVAPSIATSFFTYELVKDLLLP
ncbi:hypothetical protein H0H87_000197 [Tephrocybe sp. NHM501043]|nr:hypothetical protein H0H87_000197 [Tephrocybe sp. NHM501043]